MPERPVRDRRIAVAVSVWPETVGLRKEMSAPAATVTRSSSLHAIAKAVSARAKTNPPWVIWKPLVMSSRTRIETTACPGSSRSTTRPNEAEARSRSIMARLGRTASVACVVACVIVDLLVRRVGRRTCDIRPAHTNRTIGQLVNGVGEHRRGGGPRCGGGGQRSRLPPLDGTPPETPRSTAQRPVPANARPSTGMSLPIRPARVRARGHRRPRRTPPPVCRQRCPRRRRYR